MSDDGTHDLTLFSPSRTPNSFAMLAKQYRESYRRAMEAALRTVEEEREREGLGYGGGGDEL